MKIFSKIYLIWNKKFCIILRFILKLLNIENICYNNRGFNFNSFNNNNIELYFYYIYIYLLLDSKTTILKIH